MANLPWEPCPRCGEKQVDVVAKADKVGGNIGMWFVIGVLAFGAWKFVSATGASIGALIIAIPVIFILALLFGWIIVPLLLAGGAIVGGVASAGVKGYDAKCKVCSYQWEITEERAKELQAQTPAR